MEAASSSRPDRAVRWAVPVVAALAAGAFAGQSWSSGQVNPDEHFYLVAARQVAEGALPYRDFAYTQMPLFPWLAALWLALAGWDLLALRGLGVVLAAVAAALVALLAARRGGPWLGLAVGLAFAGSVEALYYLVIGKTYGTAQVLLLLMALPLCLDPWPVRRAAWWMAVLGVVAVGVRLTVAPAVAVLWLALLWRHRAEWRVGWAVVPPLLFTVVLLGPFFALAPAEAWFWTWRYHLATTIERGSAVVLEEAFRLAPAVWLLAAAAVTGWAWPRPGARPREEAGPLLAGIAGVTVNLVVAGNYGEYAAPFVALVAAGSGQMLAVLIPARRMVALVIAGGALLVPWFTGFGPAGPAWNNPVAFHRIAVALERFTPPQAVVLTSHPAPVVASGRRLWPGTEMGAFSSSSLPEAERRRFHLVSLEELVQAVAAGQPEAVLLCRIVAGNFSFDVPRVVLQSAALQRALCEAAAARYRLVYSDDAFFLFVRPEAAPQ